MLLGIRIHIYYDTTIIYRQFRRFVIIATDGLWDYLSDKEAVEIVAGCLAQKDSNKAAYLLVERALQIAAEESGISFKDLKLLPAGSARRRKHDDTTAVVMFF